MSFNPKEFIEEILWMNLRYEKLGTHWAEEIDQGLILLDPADLSDSEETPMLGAVAVSPEELKALKEFIFGLDAGYPIIHRNISNPLRNKDNPRQFRIYGITIQVLDAKKLFLEHLDPDSIAHRFTSAQHLQSLEE